MALRRDEGGGDNRSTGPDWETRIDEEDIKQKKKEDEKAEADLRAMEAEKVQNYFKADSAKAAIAFMGKRTDNEFLGGLSTGGNNLDSLINRSNKKKSILGSFS